MTKKLTYGIKDDTVEVSITAYLVETYTSAVNVVS